MYNVHNTFSRGLLHRKIYDRIYTFFMSTLEVYDFKNTFSWAFHRRFRDLSNTFSWVQAKFITSKIPFHVSVLEEVLWFIEYLYRDSGSEEVFSTYRIPFHDSVSEKVFMTYRICFSWKCFRGGFMTSKMPFHMSVYEDFFLIVFQRRCFMTYRIAFCDKGIFHDNSAKYFIA